MRVVYLADGKSIHVKRWANHFAERGWEVHIATYAPAVDGLDPSIEQHQLFHVAGLENVIEPAIRRIRVNQVRKLIMEIEPDLVHAHGLSKNGEYAYLSGFEPYILTNWGLLDLTHIINWMHFLNMPLSTSRYNLRKGVFQRAEAITCLVEEARDLIVKLYDVDPGRVHQFPWGIDTMLFKRGYRAEVSRLKASLGIPEGERVIMSTRQIEPYYNIDNIIRASARMLEETGSHLVVRKPGGEEAYWRRLQSLAKELDTGDRVHFLDERVPYEMIPYYYNMADVSVMIPHTDQGALSLHESMACGAVVIASDLPGNREMIKDGVNGYLVGPQNVGALTEKLRLALDPVRKEEFYEKNIAWIRENADWQKNAKRMEEIYLSALESS